MLCALPPDIKSSPSTKAGLRRQRWNCVRADRLLRHDLTTSAINCPALFAGASADHAHRSNDLKPAVEFLPPPLRDRSGFVEREVLWLRGQKSGAPGRPVRFASSGHWRRKKPLRQKLPKGCEGPRARRGKKPSASGCPSIPVPDLITTAENVRISIGSGAFGVRRQRF